MDGVLCRADRVLAVWSDACFRSPFAAAELRAAFVRHAGDEGRIVPVLVEPATVPELYASLMYVDLVGLDEAAAGARLRTRLAGRRPGSAPPFPTARGPVENKPVFAGRLPAVWNVPP